ncbi:MAG: hypothetical protein ACFFD5_05450 [Candidatus Thorarchaeota archaeon]
MIIITHLLAGILIQVLCFKFFSFPFDFLLTILFAFLSHFILDALVNITYHTPDPRKEDKFWLFWRVFDYSGTAIICIIFFFPYVLGMLFANMMDIVDWVIMRPIYRKKVGQEEFDWNKNFIFHELIAKFRDKLLFWLPNWRFKKYGIIPELIIITGFLILIIILI